MHQALEGKRILFLSPAFFGYEDIIKNKMEEMGARVTFYDERSVNSARDRALLKVNPNIFRKKTYEYYKRIITENADAGFDYILIIKCDMPSEQILEELHSAFPKAKFCLHVWDSIKNIPDILNKVKHFDYATSFDRHDCDKNVGFRLRPLFFSDAFFARSEHNGDYRYDLAFCGTIHSDRYDVLKQLEEQCRKANLRFYGFYYLQSRFIYSFYKLTKKSFRGISEAIFSFEKKSHGEIADIEDSSRIIVDIQHPAQSGLTMRTIEMVGMKKKLITTNADVANYDFYNRKNICIIDRKNPTLDREFLEEPYEDIPEDIYRKYSVAQWILDVLGIGDRGNNL